MDWTIIFTNLNYLSLFLLFIFGLVMIALLMHAINYWLMNDSCPSTDTWTPQYLNNSRINVSTIEDQLRRWQSQGEGVLSKSFNVQTSNLSEFPSTSSFNAHQLPRYSNVLDLTDFNQLNNDLYKSSIKDTNNTNELIKDPDTDSLISATTDCSLYMDQRLSVDLNEQSFMFVNRYSRNPDGRRK